MIFDGTLRNWPTSTGTIFDGHGIGPDSKLKIFPFQNDEYDYSHDVFYDYSKGTEKIHFKSPGVYSDGKTTFSNYIMNDDGTSGRFNSEFTFDSVTSNGHFSMYQNSTPYNTPPPGSPTSLNYFTLDTDLSISSIVIGNITKYTWIPPSSSSSPYSSIPQVSSGPWDDAGPSVSSGPSNYAGSSNPIVSNIITT
jgi:hypothetical protein